MQGGSLNCWRRSKKKKNTRRDICSELIRAYRDAEEEFFRGTVTADEPWIHHYQPETRHQSMEWTHPGSPAPKKVKVPYPPASKGGGQQVIPSSGWRVARRPSDRRVKTIRWKKIPLSHMACVLGRFNVDFDGAAHFARLCSERLHNFGICVAR